MQDRVFYQKKYLKKQVRLFLILIIPDYPFLKSVIERRYSRPCWMKLVQLAKELMHLDDDHEVLFLHGGATTQFFQVPMNLLE